MKRCRKKLKNVDFGTKNSQFTPIFGQSKNFLRKKKHLVFFCLLNGWTEQNSDDPPAELRVQKAGRLEIDQFALIRLILEEEIGNDPLLALFDFV